MVIEKDSNTAPEMHIRETLIHEVHHRVKNDLQIVESLLRMDYRRSTSEEARRALLEASNRLKSMAVVHEMLSESHHEILNIVQLIRNVAEQVKNGFSRPEDSYHVVIHGSSHLLDGSKAISIALVVAEIVHNSFEHGFHNRGYGTLEIDIKEQGEFLSIAIIDDGIGLPGSFSLETSTSMGLTLIKTLVEDDLQGSIEAHSRNELCRDESAHEERGALFRFILPLSIIEP